MNSKSVNILRTDKQARPRAVIIGAGFGGIALAIRLQSRGFNVTLLERRDKPGGRAYVYEDGEFKFDGGPTVITDPDCLEQLFALSGRKIEDYVTLLPISPFYRLQWEDGYAFNYHNEMADLERQIRAKNPEDVDGYKRFLEYSKNVYEEGYEKLGTVPFLSFRQMLTAAPNLMKVQAYRSVYAMVSKYIQDEQLRQAFSFHTLLVGGNPFKTSSIYALIHALEHDGGVWFAKGGTGALVQGLLSLFKDLGGKIELDAEVSEIKTSGNRARSVHTRDGRVFDADLVASNADVVHTYANLLGKHIRGRRYGKALKRRRWSMSLFVMYFGLKTKRPDMAHHTIMFGQRYKDLIAEIFGKGRKLPKDFSLYLHAPSVTDDSLAPKGGSSYYVLSPVPHLGHAKLDWDKIGPQYQETLLDYLEEHAIPDLRRDLVSVQTLTPKGFRDDLNSHLGSAFSIEPLLYQSAWFRPHNRDDVISNVYIVGAGTHPGAGIPGVVGSAKATASVIEKDFSNAIGDPVKLG